MHQRLPRQAPSADDASSTGGSGTGSGSGEGSGEEPPSVADADRSSGDGPPDSQSTVHHRWNKWLGANPADTAFAIKPDATKGTGAATPDSDQGSDGAEAAAGPAAAGAADSAAGAEGPVVPSAGAEDPGSTQGPTVALPSAAPDGQAAGAASSEQQQGGGGGEGGDQQAAAAAAASTGAPASPSPSPPTNGTGTIAEMLDRALDKEFEDETKEGSVSSGKTFTSTATSKPAAVETVVRISGGKVVKPAAAAAAAAEVAGKQGDAEASAAGPVVGGGAKAGNSTAEGAPSGAKAGAGGGGGAAVGSSGASPGGGGGGASAAGGDTGSGPAAGGGGGGGGGGDGAAQGAAAAGDGGASSKEDGASGGEGELPSVEVGVDRIIDSQDNEFVLSAPKPGSIASLTLDPLLIQDITLVLSSAALFGTLFESIKQPVINGYLVAGAVVGPGGLQLIKELVQVESLAQLGVQLLLFGLGRELSMSRLRPVLRVALLGGTLQIAALMLIGGAVGGVIGGSVPQGLFVGALLSMSSTSVVIKCLETTRSTATLYGQLTIGTLVLQDCSVGLMFALMPAFAAGLRKAAAGPAPAAAAAAAASAAASAAARNGTAARAAAAARAPDSAVAAALAAAAADNDVWARLAVALMVLRVLAKLGLVALVAYTFARTVLPLVIRYLVRRASVELVQLSLVAFCFGSAWVCGHLEVSEELGAFLSGVMVASAERHLVGRGVLIPSNALTSTLSGDASPRGAAAAAAMAAASGALSGAHGPSAAPVCASIESISNVLSALFMASIGLLMSPVFLWHHAAILLAGTAVVAAVKALVIAGVVQVFGVPARTAWAAGLTMAHTGEFSFVLLSMARQLKLLPESLYMLLLGVTAMSLLTTPMVILVSYALLQPPGAGGAPVLYQQLPPGPGGLAASASAISRQLSKAGRSAGAIVRSNSAGAAAAQGGGKAGAPGKAAADAGSTRVLERGGARSPPNGDSLYRLCKQAAPDATHEA